MLSNAGLSLTNKMVPRLTFKYEHPRKVTLYNVLASCKVVFDLALMHDKELASITPTEEESFFQLAVLDVEDALYQTMKHYAELNTVYGNINLKLDEWSQAKDLRKALVDDWDSLYHMDVMPFTYA